MKIVRFSCLDFIPASHEDPKDPGALKKVLLTRDNLPEGRIQMINWAKIPKNRSFTPHSHEAMIEVFIIMNGRVKVKIDSEEEKLQEGDMVISNSKQVHTMTNICDKDVNYLCVGVVTEESGKTVTV